MSKLKNLTIVALGLSAILIAFSGSHPTSATGGYTSAPGDGICSQCHTDNNTSLDGEFIVSGVPDIIEANTTYTVDIQLTNPSGNASRGGFQILALDSDNTQGGSWANESAGASFKTSSGKTYLGHQGSQTFPASNELNWSGEWTSPDEMDVTFNFYAVSILANGGNGNQNDRFFLEQFDATIESVSLPLNVSANVVSDETCAGASDGNAMVTISGGTEPYSIMWSNGETTTTATMLPGGLNSVTVTDDNGEMAEEDLDIATTGANINISITNQIDILCFGDAGGSATVEATGGASPYVYEWSNGTIGQSLLDVASATYTVTATDINGCSVQEDIFIGQPNEMIVTQVLNDPKCIGSEDGFIVLEVTGGTSPYSYDWEDGSLNNSNFNLSAGTYITTVTDNNGCSQVVNSILQDPDPLNLSMVNIMHPTCQGDNNGSIELIPSGGTPGYSFTWSTGAATALISDLTAGSYFATVSDENDCEEMVEFILSDQIDISITVTSTAETNAGTNDGTASVTNINGGDAPYSYLWSIGSTLETITNLSSGTYNVTVTDNNGCSTEEIVIVSAGDCALEANVTTTNVNCSGGNDGTAIVSLINATEPLSYIWSDGSTEGDRTDLIASTFSLIVLDATGCSDTVTNIIISEPEELIATIDIISNNSCIDDSTGILEAIVIGGSQPYQYIWSNTDITPVSENLSSGNFSMTVTDVNGCTTSAITNIVSIDSNTPMISLQDLVVYATDSGFNNVDATEFDNGSTDNCSEVLLSYLSEPNLDCAAVTMVQTVTIIGSDASGNSDTLDATIMLIDTIAPTLANPYDNIIQDGCQPLDFDLPLAVDNCSDSISIALIEGLPSGSEFPVGITQQVYQYIDESGNGIEFSFIVEVISDLSADVTPIDVDCYGLSTGSIIVETSGIHMPSVQDSASLNDLPAGDYEVIVTDSVGCLIVTTVTVDEPEELTVTTSTTPAEGNNTMDGEIVIVPSGGTSPYSIRLFDEQGGDWGESNTGIFSELPAGTYNALVFDDNGCNISVDEIIIEFLTSTEDLFGLYSIEVYPNPVQEQLNIKIDQEVQNLKFTLQSIDGRIIWFREGIQSTSIDVASFSSGLYLLTITDNKTTSTKKIEILR